MCNAHPFEQATAPCISCRRGFCPDCLVYAHGERRPPLCIPCAIAEAGVRRNARRSRVPTGSGVAGRVTLGLLLAGGTVAAVVPLALTLT